MKCHTGRLPINQVEGLTEEQAKDAVRAFKAKGWFETMKQKIKAIGGDADALESTDWTPHLLNVLFKAENVDLFQYDLTRRTSYSPRTADQYPSTKLSTTY